MKFTTSLILLAIAALFLATTIVPSALTFIGVSILSTILIGILVVSILKEQATENNDSYTM